MTFNLMTLSLDNVLMKMASFITQSFRQHITTALQLGRGRSAVVMQQGLLILMARNRHDVTVGQASI
jgi:hypothetical protein